MVKIIISALAFLSVLLLIGSIYLLYKDGEEIVNGEDTKENKKEKHPLITGNDKWKVNIYYKQKRQDEDRYEFRLLDFIYGDENGFTKAPVAHDKNDNRMWVAFDKVGKNEFCHGFILFDQDNGLVFEENKHEHEQNNGIYEIAYKAPGTENELLKNYCRIENGTEIFITKINDRKEKWRILFKKKTAEYKQRTVQSGPGYTISKGDEMSISVGVYKLISKLLKYMPKIKKGKNVPDEEKKEV